jgi:hypothetical protein
MKIGKLLFIGIFISGLPLKAQVAMDFNMSDCDGSIHHLYTDYLDNEEVVIIEFFMTCSSCIEVGQKLTLMHDQLLFDYPGKVNFFAFNFNDDFDCSVATDFVTTYGINAVPFDSGTAQLDYYGGFGMPSVVVVGGTSHQVIYFSKTFEGVNDTAAMDSSIRNFFTTLGGMTSENFMAMSVYPNPAIDFITISWPESYTKNLQLDIVDEQGKKVLQQNGVNSQTYDVQNLSPGMYCVVLSGDDIILTQKIIIQ